MAVNYQIPNWLHGANPLQAVTSGAELGVRIAESNQRAAIAYAELQRRQYEFQQHLEMQQQQLEQAQKFQQQRFQAEQQIAEQNQRREDQQLMVENAYKQGQLGLKRQQLEMTKAAAAEQANAQGRFVQILNTLVSGYIGEEGMTEEQARSKAYPIALQESGMFKYLNPSALAGMVKSASGGEWKVSPSGANYYDTGKGPIHFDKQVPDVVMPQTRADVSDLTSNIRVLDKQFREETDQEKKGKIEDEIIRLAETRADLLRKSRQAKPQTQQAPSTAAPPTAAEPPTAPPIKRYRYNPKTGKIEEIGESPSNEEENNANGDSGN